VAERKEISHGLAHGLSLRKIALGLGRAPSTISRAASDRLGRGQAMGTWRWVVVCSAPRKAGRPSGIRTIARYINNVPSEGVVVLVSLPQVVPLRTAIGDLDAPLGTGRIRP